MRWARTTSLHAHSHFASRFPSTFGTVKHIKGGGVAGEPFSKTTAFLGRTQIPPCKTPPLVIQCMGNLKGPMMHAVQGDGSTPLYKADIFIGCLANHFVAT